MSDLIKEAYTRLFPDDELTLNTSLKYSGRFSDFNANVKKYSNNIEFNLSKKWRGVNKEIIIGLIQDLLLKIFKKKKKTLNIDLYHNFIKNLHYTVPKTNSDPILESSFTRINNEYFDGFIEIPNIKWGRFSNRKLGSYDFHKDTISISKILLNEPRELLDYVMYHEMLHKKIKFKSGNKRTIFHSSEFRKKEQEFKDSEEIEKRLKLLAINKKKKKKPFFNFFK